VIPICRTTTAAVLEADDLGKRYRRGWALRDCSFALPPGRVSALVGPNGVGKSTLMHLATGLIRPSSGTIRVLGETPGPGGAHPRLAFLSQDKPLFRRFTVAEMLRVGQAMNADWDSAYARRLVDEAGVTLDARISTLSGGQRTRVALALAMGRRPDLVLLDEPLADLDPLARREVMQTLMAEVAETGMTVLLSSHVLTDLEGVCDHLILLTDGRARLVGDIEDLISAHRLLVGPAHQVEPLIPTAVTIEATATARQATVLVNDAGLAPGPDWEKHIPTLEDLVLAYLRAATATSNKAVAA
jgi:ABC-2 type transport system ATP-binding protein